MPFSNLAVLLALILGVGCSNTNQNQEPVVMTEAQIRAGLKTHTSTLMAMPGVTGTAQTLCDDKPCIVVYVLRREDALEKKITEQLRGYPFRIEASGEFRALPK